MSDVETDSGPPADYRDEQTKAVSLELSITLLRELSMVQSVTQRSRSSLIRQAISEFCERHGAPAMAEADADRRFKLFIWIPGRF